MTDSEKLDLLLQKMITVEENQRIMQKDIFALRQDVTELKKDVAGLKQDVAVLQQDVENLKQHVASLQRAVDNNSRAISALEQRVSDMEKDMLSLQNKVKDIALHLETKTDRNIQLLAESHANFVRKYSDAARLADENYAYHVKVNYLSENVRVLQEEMHKIKEHIGIA